MPQLTNSPPKYRKHAASGQAIVTLNGHDLYLGPYGSRASKTEYDRLIAEWLSSGRQYRPPGCGEVTVVVLMSRYVDYAEAYYKGADGKPSTELEKSKNALKYLRRLYGDTDAVDFGPLALKAVQQQMIGQGWCRKYINQGVNIIRRMFRWAVAEELVPGEVLHALSALPPLKAGRCAVPESEPVRPVPDALVEAVLPHLSRQAQAMVRLQRLTGMRPGEVVQMRGIDIDTTGRLWLYRPLRHKTGLLGHERIVPLGPKAQVTIRPFLKPDTTAYLFSPAEAEHERRRAAHDTRKTPLSCGNRPGSRRKRQPALHPGERYTANTYARAIQRGCDEAYPLPESLARRRVPRADGKEGDRWESEQEWKARLGAEACNERRLWLREHRWHPHQLRHTAATELRKNFGLEAAQVILGHQTLSVTQIYAEKNIEAAMNIMGQVG